MIVAVPEAFKVMVCEGPPFMLYVTTALAVPVNVTVADPLGQTLLFAEIVTTGS